MIPVVIDIKSRIRSAQVKAALSVNRELIELYWGIGKSIVVRQHNEGWGKSVVQRLSQDIRREFTGISGFSAQNLWKMRGFYLAWTDDIQNLSQAVRDLDGINLPQAKVSWQKSFFCHAYFSLDGSRTGKALRKNH